MLSAGQMMTIIPVVPYVKTAQHITRKPAPHGHSMKPGAATLPTLLPNV